MVVGKRKLKLESWVGWAVQERYLPACCNDAKILSALLRHSMLAHLALCLWCKATMRSGCGLSLLQLHASKLKNPWGKGMQEIMCRFLHPC